MIWAYLSLYYFDSFPFAQFSKYFSYSKPFFFKKYFSAIFQCKNYMILAIPYRMC